MRELWLGMPEIKARAGEVGPLRDGIVSLANLIFQEQYYIHQDAAILRLRVEWWYSVVTVDWIHVVLRMRIREAEEQFV